MDRDNGNQVTKAPTLEKEESNFKKYQLDATTRDVFSKVIGFKRRLLDYIEAQSAQLWGPSSFWFVGMVRINKGGNSKRT